MKKSKKLELSRETLRRLEDPSLVIAAGGATVPCGACTTPLSGCRWDEQTEGC